MRYDTVNSAYSFDSIWELQKKREIIRNPNAGFFDARAVGIALPGATVVSVHDFILTMRDPTDVLDTYLRGRWFAQKVERLMSGGTILTNVRLSMEHKSGDVYFVGARIARPPRSHSGEEDKKFSWERIRDMYLPKPVGNPV